MERYLQIQVWGIHLNGNATQSVGMEDRESKFFKTPPLGDFQVY